MTNSNASHDHPELIEALSELSSAEQRVYFDAVQDATDLADYYAPIDANQLTAELMFDALNRLLTQTHSTQLGYKPSVQLYPWVDLHPDLQLRSIYSGKRFSAEEFIRADFEIMQTREIRLREMLGRESLSRERLDELVKSLEASLPFNCEHVVPQSWFHQRSPMRGDLHHLFACEVGCNSFRSNVPYFDFPDFEVRVRNECGKREEGKFEPESGKGAVARATLYFLLRYPGEIDDKPNEFKRDRIATLLAWHSAFPVDEFERHRNQAIYQKQGNRNPLVDHAEWGDKIAFEFGLG